MSVFWKRERKVRDLLDEYFQASDDTMEAFRTTLREYLKMGRSEDFIKGDREIHRAEARADDLRREIEKTMYERMLLPESRGDILGLLEAFDKLPNVAESITFLLDTHRVEIPEAHKEEFVELVLVNLESYNLVRQQVDALFNKPADVSRFSEEIDERESQSDRKESDLIVAIVQSEVSDFVKLTLRDLVIRVGDISDVAENVSDRLEVIALKKRI